MRHRIRGVNEWVEHRTGIHSAVRQFLYEEIPASSGWHQIFPDQAMTVAAIDRLVHHATILEMNAESFRQRAATSEEGYPRDGRCRTFQICCAKRAVIPSRAAISLSVRLG